MKCISLMVAILMIGKLPAQTATDRNPDPTAQSILQDLANHIGSFHDLVYHFKFTIAYPERDENDIVEGKFLQKGSKYRLETPAHYFICDAVNKWVVDVEAKEIQIHDYVASTGEDISDPQALLNIYANPNYDYRFVYEGNQDGKNVQVIEFKPIIRGSEMAKATLIIDRENRQIQTMEVFNRDGSKLHLEIQSVDSNTNPQDDAFTVTKTLFPDFNIEDLRIE